MASAGHAGLARVAARCSRCWPLGVGPLLITAFGYGIPAWFDEELNPLIDLLTRAASRSPQIDARQYGVVVFLVFDPCACAPFGADLAALATYATWVALLAAVVVAFALIARRYAAGRPLRELADPGAWPGPARCRCCT